MDGLIECLKECNIKLTELGTDNYDFTAWIVFSTHYNCFVAGVDAYLKPDQELELVLVKCTDASAVGAMNQVLRHILDWEKSKYIPF